MGMEKNILIMEGQNLKENIHIKEKMDMEENIMIMERQNLKENI